MKYPNGEEINIGDYVLFNEGTCKGYVCKIIEFDEDFKAAGLALPGMESYEQLSNYGSSERGIYIRMYSETSDDSWCAICCESDFEDEGVCLIKRQNE